MSLTKLSLFSGILGDDLASEWAGIKTICYVEIDPFCQAVIRKHKPNMPIIGDIHDVTKEKVRELTGDEWVDIISGGDPCQPRSVAGKRRGREDDRDLWKDMFRVIQEFKPTWVINENPTGRLTMDFHEVLSDLEGIGYETRSFVIPACAINANHRRDRLFIIANSKSIHGEVRHQVKGRENSQFRRYIASYANARSIGTIHGIPTQMDRSRLKALGNAVVPQQVYPIYKAIVEVHKKLDTLKD